MKTIQKALETINKSFEQLNWETYAELVENCCNALKIGGKIIISGLGKNGPICQKAAASMTSIGINAVFVHTGEILHGDAGVVNESDLVILTSKTGNTSESIQVAKILKTHKECLIWALTFNEAGDLATKGLADKVLIMNLEEEGDPWNIMPMNSTTVTLIVLQALALELIDRLNLTKADFLKNHLGGGIGKSNKI